MPEADTGGVTVIESSTPIAETASSKTNSALQPEDATTRACSIQYETSISLLGGKNLHRVTVLLFIFGSLERMFVMYLFRYSLL